ncbi:UNVERIFIED_CONTAM: hypothetical protein Scaly_3000500 [Sesamum calycinum]|uniref:Uncharacterized protein n=1 Tax=Sesamum calycinum TaxID=2727403 RepID=A0AAW2KEU8_9LAMI
MIMETNKFTGTNYNDWLWNLRNVLDFEKGLCLGQAAPDGLVERKGALETECSQLLSNPDMFVIEVNMITNSASWVLDADCGAHICNNLLVLERSKRLRKDEMILKLGDGNVVAAEAIGSLNLVISDHIRIELKNCYYVPSMIKNIISIFVLDNDGYAFTINKNSFYLMIDSNSHLLVPQKPYEIWYGKSASYKYLRVWGSPAYFKRLVGDKLDSRSSLCGFVGYPKETAGYYFYDPSEQKELLDETSEAPQQNNGSFEPMVSIDSVPVLCRSVRESRPPDRYGFLGLTSQLDNDPRTYGEAILDIDLDKWLKAMRSEMDSMGSNKFRPS